MEETMEDEEHKEYNIQTGTPTIQEVRTYPSTEDPEGTYRLCKRDKCSNIVPRSRNPGVPRLFCSDKCAGAYHTAAYRRRNRSKTGQYLEKESRTGAQLQFYRIKPRTFEIAEARYRGHLEQKKCPNAEFKTGFRCPAHVYEDYYSEKKLCLLYAVIVDDMKEKMAHDNGRDYIRKNTTHDGRWLDMSELAPHLDPEAGIVPPEATAPYLEQSSD